MTSAPEGRASSSTLRRSCLRGHTSDILCLASNRLTPGRPQDFLCSGSEDGTARLWDIGRTRTSVRMLTGFGGDDVNSVSFSKGNPSSLWIAVSNQAYEFDLRKTDVILTKESSVRRLSSPSKDDICQIGLNDNGNYLAAADDSGEVRVFDLSNKDNVRVFKTLRGHESICSSVVFRPNRQWDVISGALDSCIYLWDFSKPRVVQSFNLSTDEQDEQQGVSGPLFNPPFVHSVDVSSCGNTLAAACGDSKVRVYDLRKGIKTHGIRFHSSSVSKVHFSAEDSERFLYTGGNDCRILLLDLHAVANDDERASKVFDHHDVDSPYVDITTEVTAEEGEEREDQGRGAGGGGGGRGGGGSGRGRGKRGKGRRGGGGRKGQQRRSRVVPTTQTVSYQISLFAKRSIQHTSKVNDLVSLDNDVLAVAGQSEDVVLYEETAR
eukprot:TRINITY_DN6520_c0_g1_i1.p1 TRINITY_DN6520_c0_g1~~TRINITY_DN6520_c0_g1_i1.p1  ORF type:complete len:436 (-),score=70.74 TRINITY_DN6520_c0_g1_i1:41-1348(-)